MKEDEFLNFQTEWNTANDLSASNHSNSQNAINQAFEILKCFAIGDVVNAIRAHTISSKFAVTPNDVIEIIEKMGISSPYSEMEKPNADQIVAMARAGNTPLGIIAKIKIGSFDLSNQDAFYLRERANELLAGFDAIIDRCVNSNYDSHEIETMKKYGVDPSAPLAAGLPSPQNNIKKLEVIRLK